MNTTHWFRAVSWILLVCLVRSLQAGEAQEARKKPPQPEFRLASITYSDAETGKPIELSGSLWFKTLPVMIGGSPAPMGIAQMVSFRTRSGWFTSWVKRMEDDEEGEPRFVICCAGFVAVCRLGFDRIDVRATEDPEKPGMGRGEEETPSPLKLVVEEKPEGLEAIPVRALRRIDIRMPGVKR